MIGVSNRVWDCTRRSSLLSAAGASKPLRQALAGCRAKIWPPPPTRWPMFLGGQLFWHSMPKQLTKKLDEKMPLADFCSS